MKITDHQLECAAVAAYEVWRETESVSGVNSPWNWGDLKPATRQAWRAAIKAGLETIEPDRVIG